MTNERDRGAVRAAARRWPRRFAKMDGEKQDKLVDGLMWANDLVRRCNPESDEQAIEVAKAMESIVRTGAVITRIQQADDHAEDGLGKNEVNVNVHQNQVIVVEHDRGG